MKKSIFTIVLLLGMTLSSYAQEPFIGEIRMFAGNFAPRGWAFCDGQLLNIDSNSALFSILGTTYGGDGRTTFGLPDLRGRVSVHAGGSTGPGLTPYRLGQKGGGEYNVLTTNQMPSHHHTVTPKASDAANSGKPTSNFIASPGVPAFGSVPNENMGTYNTGNTGASQSVNNIQPYTAVNYIIALQGLYPSRS